MALTDDELATIAALSGDLADAQPSFDRAEGYYQGMQRLEQLGLAIPPDLRRFVTVVNWPRLAVDSLEERLDVTGFRRPGSERADTGLWEVWQANNLDEESQLGHLDAFVYRRSYVCVGTNEDEPDVPLVTVESPREVVTSRDARTGRTTAALRLYDEQEGVSRQATLYLPEQTIYCERDNGTWTDVDRDEHGLGSVCVVPIVNRPRLGDRSGQSEMHDVVSLTDAAARALTNLQVAQETHAVPQRWALGMTEGDFVDQDGKQLPAWEAYFGAIWATGSGKDEAQFGQFTSSDLRNFHDTVNHYARLVASVTGLPPHYLAMSTDNPASADAIKASEVRLVRRAKRKQRVLSGSWEEVMRLVDRFRTGVIDPDLRRLETVWADPETPTRAQTADAVVKLVQARVLPIEAAWEELGYGPERIDDLRAMREREASDPVLESIARDLVDTTGNAPASSG